VIRNSKSLSGIQRAAGGEMAAALLMSEWTCEVTGTNLLIASIKESMPVRIPPLSWDRV